VIGVKAIDKDGNQSLVSVYEQGATNTQRPANAADGAGAGRSGGQR
jgi:hypothetical protein